MRVIQVLAFCLETSVVGPVIASGIRYTSRTEPEMRSIIALLLTTITGCGFLSSEPNETTGSFEVRHIEHLKEWPQDGVFYSQSAETGLRAKSRAEAEVLLDRMQAEGVPLRSAWFKEGASSCGTPGGVAFTVVVPTELVIQLDQPSSAETLEGFDRMEQPSMSCPYLLDQIIPFDR